MFDDKRILGVIPARGGSKGIPRKNIKEIGGKPLIAWTIIEAKKSKYIDRLILSSEDEEVVTIAKHWGCDVPFIRPKEFAKDDAPGVDPVIHALEKLPNFDYVVLLQPTSPLRLVEDIDNCAKMCIQRRAKACVSVTESTKNPYWMYKMRENYQIIPLLGQEFITRRQDLPMVYALNGAVFVAETEFLKQSRSFITSETIAYIMPQFRSIDIDTEFDMKICEYVLLSYR